MYLQIRYLYQVKADTEIAYYSINSADFKVIDSP